MQHQEMPGFGDPSTWPACAGHPGDPRTKPDDESLSEADALMFAADENERTPAHFAAWLAEAADNPHKDRTPADLEQLRERIEAGEALTPGQWVALLVAGCDADGIRARHALIEAFREAPVIKGLVRDRAAELLATQDEAAEVERIEALAELHAEAA